MAKQIRRGKGRRRGAAARANNDLAAHIESLGLDGVEAYKRWCHECGFTAALNKSWQERRQERAAAQRAKEKAQALDEVVAHAEKLGLKDIEQYQSWCRAQGLGDSLYKSAAQRRKEFAIAQRLRGEVALANVKKRVRRSASAMAQVCEGQLRLDELHSEELRGVYRACALLDDAARLHYRDLLLCAEKRARPRRVGRSGAGDGFGAELRRGRFLEHCSAVFAGKCDAGPEYAADKRTRVLTIAVHNPGRNIVEVRGKYNAVARRSAKNPQNQAFERQYRELLAQSGRAMRQWMQQEQLGRANRSY